MTPRNIKQLNATGGTPNERDEVVYADYSPFMMISEPSLDELNTRLKKKVSMRSFRPNFVIRGCSAYAEVSLQKLSNVDIFPIFIYLQKYQTSWDWPKELFYYQLYCVFYLGKQNGSRQFPNSLISNFSCWLYRGK